jgi:cytochrome c oxidase subunit 3
LSSPTHTVVSKLTLDRFGLWLFIFSESAIFVALLASRFYLTGFEVPAEANQTVALVITSILLLSSGSAYLAEAASRFGDKALFRRAMAATLILGSLFLIGVGVEWREAFHAFPPSTLYGSSFFLMTGMHAFHVVTGMIFLGIVYRMSRGSPAAHKWPVEASVKYWHFVDVVWVFFYPALYLIG